MNFKQWAKEHLLHKIVAGSHLYGTARPDSDIDIRGVCSMPAECIYGLTRFDQYQSQDGEDIVIYALTKFFRLALDANPNILDILCAPPDRWLIETSEWREVYDNRHLFLSQKLRYTFSGYAISQLKRIKGHRRWLTNPPSHKPILEDFRGKVENGKHGEQSLVFPSQHFEQQYKAALKNWKDYQRWLIKRNPARAELERKYGYDTKHASHLVRLMLQVQNILSNGDYNPILSSADKHIVLLVLRGGMKYGDLVDWAEEADEHVKTMQTDLPHSPDRVAAEALLMRLNGMS